MKTLFDAGNGNGNGNGNGPDTGTGGKAMLHNAAIAYRSGNGEPNIARAA